MKNGGDVWKNRFARVVLFSDMPPTSIPVTSTHHYAHTGAPARPVRHKNALTRAGDATARWLLIALFALLPAFVLPLPWAAVAQSKMLLAGGVLIVALVAWAIARIIDGTIHVPRSWLLYVGLLLPLAYVISTAVGGWTNTSLVGQGIEQDTLAAVFLWYALFALVTFVFNDHKAGIRTALRALFLGLSALAVIEILFIFFPATFSLGGALQGTTANPLGSWHDLGILMGLSLFFSIALFRSGIFNGFWKALPIVLGVLSAFLIVIIHFTDVFWGVAALAFAGLIAVLRASIQAEGVSVTSGVGRALPWLVVVVVAVLLAFFGTQLGDKLPTRIQRTEIEVRPSWQGTFDVAKQSLGAPSSLLFGSGPNSFIREWGMHKPQSVNLTPFWNSDFNYGIGVIPTSIFAVGLFGLFAWAALLLVLLGLLFRYIREVRPLTPGRTLFGALLVAVVYLVGFHMIYTPGVALTGLTFMLLGLLAVAAAGDAPARAGRVGIFDLRGLLSLIALLILSGVSVAAAGVADREVLSNLYVNKGSYVYQTSNDAVGAGRAIGSALSIAPQNDRAHRAAAELGIVELAMLIQTGQADEAARTKLQETLQNTIQHGLTAVEIDGANYQNWLSLAQIYSNLAGANVEGAMDSAKNAYNQAFTAQPTNPVPKLRLAQIAVAENDLAAARTNLQEAITLKPDFAAAYYLLSQVEAAAGQGDPAVQAAATAVQLVPEDPVGWFNLGYILYAGQSYANAAQALERAATLTPDYANALFILGLTYNALDRTQDALTVLTRVGQLNPGETWIQQLMGNIQAGKEPFDGIQQGGTPATTTP
jgi:Tfp pilus assembly protein PilF